MVNFAILQVKGRFRRGITLTHSGINAPYPTTNSLQVTRERFSGKIETNDQIVAEAKACVEGLDKLFYKQRHKNVLLHFLIKLRKIKKKRKLISLILLFNTKRLLAVFCTTMQKKKMVHNQIKKMLTFLFMFQYLKFVV